MDLSVANPPQIMFFENSTVLRDLQKWPKIEWGGDRPLSPPLPAPLLDAAY